MTIEPNPDKIIEYQTDFPNTSEVDFEKELSFVSKVLNKFGDDSQENKSQRWNAIDMFGLSISSQTESLAKVERTLNRIIAKHKPLFNHEVRIRKNFYG